uniref:E3 ubiquitin-protein ligase MARCHF6 n=1 Tax=Cyanistes caeruleus TaxID=156563 RepID=A0A8C0US53_CYACU
FLFLSLLADICRVCRSEGTPEKPLYHPCVCTGSIKFIHQECLVQWLKHSRKEYCELCKHRFAFTPSKYVLLAPIFFQNFSHIVSMR